jgi:hypothetical protein
VTAAATITSQQSKLMMTAAARTSSRFTQTTRQGTGDECQAVRPASRPG